MVKSEGVILKENDFGVEFNGPVNTVKVMSDWLVYLTTLFLASLVQNVVK